MTTNGEYLKAILPLLAKPMPYKWRVQSFSKQKPEATCVAYIDARDVMERLDNICDYGWERSHEEIKGHIYSTVTIIMPDGSRMSRSDCGTESETEAEKGESSDSFKRAAVNWGVGRFLYDLEIKRVPASDKKEQGKYPYVVDSSGKRVWDLTKHINGSTGKIADNKMPPKKAPSNLTIGDDEFNFLIAQMDEVGVNKEAFCKHFEVPSVAALPMERYAVALQMIHEKRRKNSLKEAEAHSEHGNN